MTDENADLTEVPRIKRSYNYNKEWNFYKGDVREAFKRVFSPEAEYVLFQTIANKKAVAALSNFSNSLMESYQSAINKIANEKIGNKNYANYSMVKTIGVHSMDRDPNAIFWPRIYIVNAEKQKELKEIIDNLSRDESFEILREIESPQFYHMPEIETLHNLGIKPISRLPKELKVKAQDLAMYVDFLAQMTETYRWTGSVIEID